MAKRGKRVGDCIIYRQGGQWITTNRKGQVIRVNPVKEDQKTR